MKKLAVLFAALLMVPAAFAQENEGFAPIQLAFLSETQNFVQRRNVGEPTENDKTAIAFMRKDMLPTLQQMADALIAEENGTTAELSEKELEAPVVKAMEQADQLARKVLAGSDEEAVKSLAMEEGELRLEALGFAIGSLGDTGDLSQQQLEIMLRLLISAAE